MFFCPNVFQLFLQRYYSNTFYCVPCFLFIMFLLSYLFHALFMILQVIVYSLAFVYLFSLLMLFSGIFSYFSPKYTFLYAHFYPNLFGFIRDMPTLYAYVLLGICTFYPYLRIILADFICTYLACLVHSLFFISLLCFSS